MPLVMVEWWGWRQLDTVGDSWTRDDWKRSRVTTIWIICSSVQEHLDSFPADLAPAESQCATKASGVCALAELTQELRDRRKVRCIFSGMARRLKKSLEGAAQHQQAEIAFDHRAMLRQILGTCMLWNFAKIDGLDAWRMSLLNIILRFTKILSVSSWEARKFVPFFHGIEVVAVQRAWIFWLHFSLSLHLSSAAQELWVPRSST